MTTETKLNKLAKELYDAVLIAYENNPNLTYSEILSEHLAKYNDDVAKLLNVEIGNIMNATVGGISSTVKPLTGVALSSVLYKNSQYVAKQVLAVINEHLQTKSTIAEISKAIYDGYGYDHILDIAKSAELPKYITNNLTEARIKKLKTKSLAAGYFEVLDAKNDRQLKKAMYVAAQEKSRYMALRIAATEEHRAFSLMLAQEYMEEGVEYVIVTLSSSHKTVCVCDYHASYNSGYGRGVYPLRSAPMPPFHPFCKCVLRPVDNTRWRKAKPEGFLNDFTKQQQIDMLRGRDSKWGTKTVGEIF